MGGGLRPFGNNSLRSTLQKMLDPVMCQLVVLVSACLSCCCSHTCILCACCAHCRVGGIYSSWITRGMRESPPNTLTADIFNSYFTNTGLDTVSHLQPTPTTCVDGGENDLFWRGSNNTCCFDFTTIEQDSVKKKPS